MQLVKARPFLFLSIIYLYSISNIFSASSLSVALRRRRFPPFTNAYVCVTFISVCVMYISASSSSSSALSSILRARSRLFASSPYLSGTFAASSSASSPPPVSGYRSLSFSSAVRSLRCSVPRWSHGVDWRSPIGLRSQIRAVAPVIEQFQRKIATMGILY